MYYDVVVSLKPKKAAVAEMKAEMEPKLAEATKNKMEKLAAE